MSYPGTGRVINPPLSIEAEAGPGHFYKTPTINTITSSTHLPDDVEGIEVGSSVTLYGRDYTVSDRVFNPDPERPTVTLYYEPAALSIQ